MSNFSGIKIGDTIAVIGMYGLTKAVVDAVTPATFVAGNQRFNKSNGFLRGEEGPRRTLARPWTQKHDDLLLKRDAQEKKQGIVPPPAHGKLQRTQRRNTCALGFDN